MILLSSVVQQSDVNHTVAVSVNSRPIYTLPGTLSGHQILVTAYYILRDQVAYHEPAPGELEAKRRARAQTRAVDQLRQLGFEVTLTPKQPAA